VEHFLARSRGAEEGHSQLVPEEVGAQVDVEVAAQHLVVQLELGVGTSAAAQSDLVSGAAVDVVKDHPGRTTRRACPQVSNIHRML